MASKSKGNAVERLVPLLVFVSIALAFGVGILWQKVSNLEGGGVAVKGVKEVEQAPDTGDVGNPPPAGPTQGKLSEDQASKVQPITSEDHVRGNRNARVFLIEYSEFECPFCGRFHPTAQQVVDEYGGDVAWVYRHFPLDQLHPNARPAAEASECAAELGGEDAFWAFTDAIFSDQTKLSDIAAIASSVGVSGSAYDSCVSSEKYADLVEEQYQAGLTAGITGTPGNFIVNANGDAWLIPGALPFETLKVTIDEALEG